MNSPNWIPQGVVVSSASPQKDVTNLLVEDSCRLLRQTLNELANQGAPLSSLPQKDVTNLLLHSFDTVSYVTLNELANWSPFEQSPSKRCDQPTFT